MVIAIDFETVSTKSLKDSGTYSYLSSPNTFITLMSICEFDISEALRFIKDKSYDVVE